MLKDSPILLNQMKIGENEIEVGDSMDCIFTASQLVYHKMFSVSSDVNSTCKVAATFL